MDERMRALLPAMAGGHDAFLAVVADLRPELHRYCARMTGSTFDGEDVVQDTLAKAYFALAQMNETPNLRPWLFRIAHNTALDFLRRYESKYVDVMAELPEREAEEAERGVDPDLVEAALTVFATLTPTQRAALILKDVLGHSLAEIAVTLEMTTGAVKSALSRARANVVRVKTSSPPARASGAPDADRTHLQRYVDLFNARDWSGLRSLIGDEARLDQSSIVQRRLADAGFFDRYAEILKTEDIRAVAGEVDGVPAIAMFRPPSSDVPAYFTLVAWNGDRVSFIHDYRYVPYIGDGARFVAY